MPRYAGPDYVALTLPSHPGATLVGLRTPDEGIIGLGAHFGPAEVTERIKETHRLWIRARAARFVSGGEDEILAHLWSLGGKPFARGAFLTREEGLERLRELVPLAEFLAMDDPLRATRRIENAMHVEGDAGLYDRVFQAMARVREIEGLESISTQAAQRLEAATPGPATTLARMLAEIRGLPRPDDAIVLGTHENGDPTAIIGSLVVSPRLPGPAHPVEVTVVASYDLGSAEFEPDGSFSFANNELKVVHDPATRFGAAHFNLERDECIQAAVADLLQRRGLSVSAEWSEMGRQTSEAGDMDVDFELAEMLFPDVIASERLKATVATGLQA